MTRRGTLRAEVDEFPACITTFVADWLWHNPSILQPCNLDLIIDTMAASSEAAGVEMDSDQLELSVGVVGNASFSSAKIAMIKTLVQNFVFTTEQIATLLDTISMSSDKVSPDDTFDIATDVECNCTAPERLR